MHVGTVTEGKLADLAIADGDLLAEPHVLVGRAGPGWSCSSVSLGRAAARQPGRP